MIRLDSQQKAVVATPEVEHALQEMSQFIEANLVTPFDEYSKELAYARKSKVDAISVSMLQIVREKFLVDLDPHEGNSSRAKMIDNVRDLVARLSADFEAGLLKVGVFGPVKTQSDSVEKVYSELSDGQVRQLQRIVDPIRIIEASELTREFGRLDFLSLEPKVNTRVVFDSIHALLESNQMVTLIAVANEVTSRSVAYTRRMLHDLQD